MRVFIAIDFKAEIKKRIADLQKKIRENCTSGRWKYIDNFHLTLRFLGEVSAEQIHQINSSLKQASKEIAPFTLRLSKLGSFESKNCIRVLWLGLEGEIEKLRNLQFRIENMLNAVGFDKEIKPYTPHITLGQDVIPKEGINLFNQFNLQDNIIVDKITLMKSEQINQKRVYSPVSYFLLEGKKSSF